MSSLWVCWLAENNLCLKSSQEREQFAGDVQDEEPYGIDMHGYGNDMDWYGTDMDWYRIDMDWYGIDMGRYGINMDRYGIDMNWYGFEKKHNLNNIGKTMHQYR